MVAPLPTVLSWSNSNYAFSMTLLINSRGIYVCPYQQLYFKSIFLDVLSECQIDYPFQKGFADYSYLLNLLNNSLNTTNQKWFLSGYNSSREAITNVNDLAVCNRVEVEYCYRYFSSIGILSVDCFMTHNVNVTYMFISSNRLCEPSSACYINYSWGRWVRGDDTDYLMEATWNWTNAALKGIQMRDSKGWSIISTRMNRNMITQQYLSRLFLNLYKRHVGLGPSANLVHRFFRHVVGKIGG